MDHGDGPEKTALWRRPRSFRRRGDARSAVCSRPYKRRILAEADACTEHGARSHLNSGSIHERALDQDFVNVVIEPRPAPMPR